MAVDTPGPSGVSSKGQTETRPASSNGSVTAGWSSLLLAADELLQPVVRRLVRPLLGRRLHQERARREERALEAAIHGDLAGADGVDHDPRRVGRVPDLQPQLHVDGLVAEPTSLHPDVRPLAV